MTSVPVSVMAADVEHESLWVILKIISAKTKALAWFVQLRLLSA